MQSWEKVSASGIPPEEGTGETRQLVKGVLHPFSLRQDFAAQWQQLTSATATSAPLTVSLPVRRELLPDYTQAATTVSIERVGVFAVPKAGVRLNELEQEVTVSLNGTSTRLTVHDGGTTQLLHHAVAVPVELRQVEAHAGGTWPFALTMNGTVPSDFQDIVIVAEVSLTFPAAPPA